MHVNYYTKYSALEKDKIINDEDFILFISSIAYYFDIGIIAIYAEYKMCENDEINENMDYGSYCVDIHNYITKMHEQEPPEVKEKKRVFAQKVYICTYLCM